MKASWPLHGNGPSGTPSTKPYVRKNLPRCPVAERTAVVRPEIGRLAATPDRPAAPAVPPAAVPPRAPRRRAEDRRRTRKQLELMCVLLVRHTLTAFCPSGIHRTKEIQSMRILFLISDHLQSFHVDCSSALLHEFLVS